MPWAALILMAGFIAGIAGLRRYFRKEDEEGSYDFGPSSVSRPGLRRLFDFGPGGWTEDGINQRPLD